VSGCLLLGSYNRRLIPVPLILLLLPREKPLVFLRPIRRQEVRVTVKRAVSGAVFVGILVGLAPTLRECWAGLDNASRVHPYQPTTHTMRA
jgi:hypothetical protein